MKTTYCEKCGKSFRNCNFLNHNCNKKQPKFKILEEWKRDDDLYKCPKCDLSFSKNGLIGHFYRKHDDRGLNFLKKRKENSKKFNKKKLTKEEKSKILSEAMKKSHSEGKHPGWNFINKSKD